MRPPYLPKYRAKKVEKTGIGFDSKLESALHDVLLLRVLAGELVDLRVKHKVYLTAARIGAIPDFSATLVATGETWFFESKGFESERWQIIYKLWPYYGPGPMEIWKGSYRRPYLHEVVIPKGVTE